MFCVTSFVNEFKVIVWLCVLNYVLGFYVMIMLMSRIRGYVSKLWYRCYCNTLHWRRIHPIYVVTTVTRQCDWDRHRLLQLIYFRELLYDKVTKTSTGSSDRLGVYLNSLHGFFTVNHRKFNVLSIMLGLHNVCSLFFHIWCNKQ